MVFSTSHFAGSNSSRTVSRKNIPRVSPAKNAINNNSRLLNDTIVGVKREIGDLILHGDKRREDTLCVFFVIWKLKLVQKVQNLTCLLYRFHIRITADIA
jgi:hypothetical protein